MSSWRSSRASSTDPPDPAALATGLDWTRLDQLLDAEPLAALSGLATAHSGRVALVGGALRDALLGLRVQDLDLIVESDLEGFLDAIESRRGRRPSSIRDRFQDTHRFRWKGCQVDVAVSQGDIEEDLQRRDFSVNAMALPLPAERPPSNALIDPFGGLADLCARRIRCTGATVLEADPLRTMRAVRYATGLDGFALESETRVATREHARALASVAAERVHAEWMLILQQHRWLEGVRLASTLGLAAVTIGPLSSTRACEAWEANERLAGEPLPSLPGRVAALVCDLAAESSVQAVARRLEAGRWPPRLVRPAELAAGWSRQAMKPGADSVGWALENPDAATIAGRLAEWLARAQGRAVPESATQARLFARRAREPRWVRGQDLVGWGMAPGPEVGKLLEEAARGQLTRRWDDREEACRWAHQRSAEHTR